MTAPFIARNTQELIDALRYRRRQQGLSQLALDERAGLHNGYCGKMELAEARTAAGKKWGRHVKLGPIFDAWIQSLGCAIAVVPLRHVRPRAPADERQLVLPLPEFAPRPEMKKRRRRHKRKVASRATAVKGRVSRKTTIVMEGATGGLP